MSAARQGPPAVVIHGPDDIRLVLEAAGRIGQVAVTLVSAADAACFMGPAWWQALVGQAADLYPQIRRDDLLDCGNAAGRAMEALRSGGRGLILSLSCPQHAAVLERGLLLGATVLPARPAALDLAERGAARRLDSWLSGGEPPGSGDNTLSLG